MFGFASVLGKLCQISMLTVKQLHIIFHFSTFFMHIMCYQRNTEHSNNSLEVDMK